MTDPKQHTPLIPISAFEYAIMGIADPEMAKRYRPLTKEEEYNIRMNRILERAKKFKIKQQP